MSKELKHFLAAALLIAAACGTALIVLRRPEETGETFEEIVQSCEELMRCL